MPVLCIILSDKQKLQTSAQTLTVVTNQDIVLCSSLGLDNTMALRNSTDHSYQDVPGVNLTLGCPSWIEIAAQTLGIYVDSGDSLGHRHQYRPWPR